MNVHKHPKEQGFQTRHTPRTYKLQLLNIATPDMLFTFIGANIQDQEAMDSTSHRSIGLDIIQLHIGLDISITASG